MENVTQENFNDVDKTKKKKKSKRKSSEHQANDILERTPKAAKSFSLVNL